MAFKLKGLVVRKVDFVPAGANQGAEILLYKSKEPPNSNQSALRKALAGFLHALGIGQDDTAAMGLENAVAGLAKGQDAVTFGEQMDQVNRRHITNEIWDVCYALNESFCSIICDDDTPDKSALMLQSLGEFSDTLKSLITIWTSGAVAQLSKSDVEMTPERLDIMCAARDRLDAQIQKVSPLPTPAPVTTGAQPDGSTSKGDHDMIDKSLMSAEDRAALEALEKKYDNGQPAATNTPAAAVPAVKAQEVPPVQPSAAPEPAAPATPPQDGGDDIYKGLHPAVAAELERLRKAADAAEDRELADIAKKYEIIGKKPEELIPALKSLKAAGGDAYDQMIQVMDASVAAMEKSGIFSEVGKSGGGGAPDPWVALEKHADEIQKAAPNITRAQAIDKACAQHPELVNEYEQSR